MKKIILAGILAAFFSFPTQGQFLKKLKKKVEQRVEETVTDKVADKAASEAGKSVETLMTRQLGEIGYPTGFEQVDFSEIPESYEFDWKYEMEITTEEGDMNMTYFLKKGAPYFGMKLLDSEDMLIVMDSERNITTMFMNSGDDKIVTATKLPEVSPEDETVEEDYTYKEIGNKTILGYDSKGYQTDHEDGILTFYISSEPEVSFQEIFQGDKAKMPSNLDSEMLKEGGLLMQMNMESTKNGNTSMTCTNLEKQNLVIDKSDYNSMAGN